MLDETVDEVACRWCGTGAAVEVLDEAVGAGDDRARPGGELSDPAGVIRPAVEAALAVARAGLTADPIVPPPPPLRPYLDFARLSPRSLKAIARAVDRDDEFRARVAGGGRRGQVGRAGWLWLARPDGWADELATIEAERRPRRRGPARSATSARRPSSWRPRRRPPPAPRPRRGRAGPSCDGARSELGEERKLRGGRSTAWPTPRPRSPAWLAARAEVVRKLKDVESRLVERATELNAVKARLRRLEQADRAAGGDREAVPADDAVEGRRRVPGRRRRRCRHAGRGSRRRTTSPRRRRLPPPRPRPTAAAAGTAGEGGGPGARGRGSATS